MDGHGVSSCSFAVGEEVPLSSRPLATVAVVLAVLAAAVPARGQDKALETEHLRLVYDETLQSHVAEYAARCFENAYAYHHRLFGYTPNEKVTVGLYDYSDFGNGGAVNTPRNTIIFTIAPINFVYETSPSNERINTTMNHEMVHIAALDGTAGSDRFFRSLFGGKVAATDDHPETVLYSFLTVPRLYCPRWYHEGLAVFLETWMAGGIGRAQGPYDEMVFRTMVRDGSRFYDPVGLVSEASRSGFMMGVNNYLYGTRFMSYLAYAYSPEAVVEWTARTEGSHKYYATQFRKVFGKSLDEAWQDWIDWEHTFQEKNLETVRRYPTSPSRDLSDRALGSVSRSYYDPGTGELYVAVRYPGTVAYIGALNPATGAIRKIRDVKGPALYFVTSLAYDPATKNLFYTADNDDWRDLHQVNALTGEHRVLQKNSRVGDLTFCPADSSLWGIRHMNGISTLVRIPPPYTKWNQILSWPFGTDMYDIDISPDGTRLVGSIAEISGRQTLRRFDTASLAAGDTASTTLYDFGNSLPANFTYSGDEKFIWGSSYYTGVSNLWRWNVQADSMEIVTNVEDGLFRPLEISPDSVVAFRYTGEGFVPTLLTGLTPLQDVSGTSFLGAETVAEHPDLARWIAPPPSAATVDTVSLGDYRASRHIGLASVYPIVEGYDVQVDTLSGKDESFPAVGLALVLSDPLQYHKLDVSVTYSPDTTVPSDERVHLSVNYDRLDWRARFKWNPASFYDLFGPTKSSRRGYVVGVGHTRNLIYDHPREMNLNVDLSGHFDIERLPNAQNVSSSADQLYNGSITLDYSNKRASLGAVAYEKGHDWTADLSATLVPAHGTTDTEIFPQLSYDLDVGFPLPIPNSSLWLRTSQGIAPGGNGVPGSGLRGKPEANFWFGGFGNNWVDHGAIKRYQKAYAFPGLELNELGGTNYQRTMVEWNLPALRFRRIGAPSFYATWARLSLFGSGIMTNIDSDTFRTRAANLGSQVDVRLTMLSNLTMTLSAGYAVAVREHRKPGDEFMFSIKIL